MKKLLLAILILTLMLVLSLTIVQAENVDAEPTADYTWAILATSAGATGATLLIVQFMKLPLYKVWLIPTRGFVYIIALSIMIGARKFTAGIVLEDMPLVAVNAFLVAMSTMGLYEITFKKLE